MRMPRKRPAASPCWPRAPTPCFRSPCCSAWWAKSCFCRHLAIVAAERGPKGPVFASGYGDQCGRDEPALCHQHIVGPAGGARVHGLDDDAGGFQALTQSRGDGEHAPPLPKQEQIDLAIASRLKNGGEVFQVRLHRFGYRPREAARREDEQRAHVDLAADAEAAIAIAFDDLSAARDERRQVQVTGAVRAACRSRVSPSALGAACSRPGT